MAKKDDENQKGTLLLIHALHTINLDTENCFVSKFFLILYKTKFRLPSHSQDPQDTVIVYKYKTWTPLVPDSHLQKLAMITLFSFPI